MDASQAQSLLDGSPGGQVAPGAVGSSLNPSTSLAPMTAQAVSQTNNAVQQDKNPLIPPIDVLAPGSESAREDYRKANQEGDVPLDIESGVDSWTRSMLSFRREQQDQVAYLEKKYGKGSVRLSSDGVPIVRVVDSQTKKLKDIRATEMGMSAKDFFDLSGQVPEIAGGMLAARFGGGGGPAAKGIVPRLFNIGAMALGTEAGGAAKDVAVRGMDGQPIDFQEIVESRAKNLPVDAAFGIGAGLTGGAVKVVTKAISPFSNPNEVTKQFREAVKYFKDKGIELPMTPGEASGSSLMLRTEAMARQLPGSSTVMKDITEKQNEAMAAIQKTAMGLPLDETAVKLPTEEQVGKRAMGDISDKLKPFEDAKAKAKTGVSETGTKELEKSIGASVGTETPVDVPKLGAKIRGTAGAKREAFTAKSAEDYGKVYAHPDADKYILSSDTLAKDATDLLKKLPAPETITQAPTGITDRFGNEILRDESGAKIMRNFVPPNVLTKLNDLAALKGGKFRLGDLLKMRTDVANDIAQGEAIPGMNTHYLSDIRGMLDRSIKSELGKLESGGVKAQQSLKKLWETANDNYAKGVKPFQKAGVAELFKEPEQPSFLGDNQVVERVFSGAKGQDNFAAYKEFFGEASPEFQGLKRAVADRLLGASRNVENQMVDPRAFLKNLAILSEKSPTVAKDVFGNNLTDLTNVGRIMTAADSADKFAATGYEKALSQHIPLKDFQAMLTKGEPTSLKLMDMIATEKAAGVLYRNSIFKQIANGTFTGNTIKPSQFVRYFSTQAEPSEVHQVMAMLSDRPEVTQQIKSKVAQDIFDRAYPTAHSVDNPALLSGEPRVLSQQGLQNALGDATQRARYKSILGADTYNDIEQLTKYLAPRGIGERAFSAAGGLSAGQQIAGLIQKGDLKYIGQAAKNWFMAQLYTHPAIRAWASNTVAPNVNTAGLTRYLIASSPMVQAAYREFGEKKAKELMAEANASIDRVSAETGGPPKSKDDLQRMQEFERALGN